MSVTDVVISMGVEMKKEWTTSTLFDLVHPERFELPTVRFVAEYSIQLSYGCITMLSTNINNIVLFYGFVKGLIVFF